MTVEALLVIFSVGATVLLVFLGVTRVLTQGTAQAQFLEGLQIQEHGELVDVNTTLTKNRVEKVTGWSGYWRSFANRAGQDHADPRTPGLIAAGSIILGAAFGYLVFPGGGIGAALVAICAPIAYRANLGRLARKRAFTLDKQLPLLLTGLRANLQAGSTPQQAIIALANELPNPLGGEIRSLRDELNVSVPLDVALAQLSARVPSREMQFLASSIEIAVRSGANLDPQLQSIETVVEQRIRLHHKLSAAIASVRPTQYAAAIAVPVFFFNSIRDPENEKFWFSSAGLPWLAGVLVFYLFGLWGIRILIKRVEKA